MKIFVDTAELEEIKEACASGILGGVTTNPSLIKIAVQKRKDRGETIDMNAYIQDILQTTAGLPVSLEVIGTTFVEMVAEGKKLYQMFNDVAKNVVIKIPVNPSFTENTEDVFNGIKAIKELAKADIPVNCTLIFTPEQALLAAKAGATYVSPFAGRIDDYIRDQNGIKYAKSDYFPAEGWEEGDEILDDNGVYSGVDLVAQCVDVFFRYDIKTEVIAASLRNPRQVREVALAGADIVTVPFDVLKGMLEHHKTREGMEKFTADVVPEYEELIKGQ